MSRWGRTLKAAGLRVVDRPVRPRPGAFGPVHGILLHHTAGRAPGDLTVVTKGRAGLPGPLSQLYLAPDGTWHVISEGRCNHAGYGSWNRRGLVIPKDQGNRYLIGVEVSSLGRDDITGKQYTALIDGVAALCRLHGWDEQRVIRHKDYAGGRKVDIRNDLARVQSDIRAALAARSAFPLPSGHFYSHLATAGKWKAKCHNGSRAADTQQVRKVQKRLGRKVTGWFSWRDKQALRVKQAWLRTKGHKVRVNGFVDRATWDALF